MRNLYTQLRERLRNKQLKQAFAVLPVILFFAAILLAAGLPVKLFAQAPTISSFTPATGPAGTLVTITGANLNNPTAFTIGGQTTIVVSNTGSVLVGMVMPNAVTGVISLTTAGGGPVTSGGTFTVTPTPYPSIQQGAKLVGTGGTIYARQGYSVSLSADGNTAIVGGAGDNGGQGAAWVYTRSGGAWTQQGSKLVGTGGTADAYQGVSVSLSADGNTAMVGGDNDNFGMGAAWVYTRSGGAWTQQGPKLVGTGAIGVAAQGWSVSLSADGNTALVGGVADNSNNTVANAVVSLGVGAAWVYTRSGGAWTQQGAKLVGTGAIGQSGQGYSVSLSADGSTAIVGGECDNSLQGAAWVYGRSGGAWIQQGSKLVGTGAIGAADQGWSVSISADGNTAIVGGDVDNSGQGATWVYTRSGGAWTQQGAKLVGTGNMGTAHQGWSVSLSADGNTAIIGGNGDNGDVGAAWVYSRSGSTWTQQGAKLVGTGEVGTYAFQGWSVSLSADGNTAIVGGVADNGAQGAAWVYIQNPLGFNPIASTPYGSADFSPGATSTYSITYTSSNLAVATIVSGNIHITGAGTSTITATDGHTTLAQPLTVTPAPLTITADNQTKTYGLANPALTVTYSGFVYSDNAASLTTQPAIATTAITSSDAGMYPITASAAASPNYTISYVAGTLTVAQASQTISFAALPTQLIPSTYDLSGVTASSGLPVSFTLSDPTTASISGNTLTSLQAGSETITASQAGNNDYLPAADVQQSFSIQDNNGDDVVVYPVVSPNGDGIDDVLNIKNIENYPDNKLILINRNGVKIFEISGYNNTTSVFDGHSNITGVFQQQGTLLYLLEFKINGVIKRKTGFTVLRY